MRGDLKPGDQLPTVRKLAIELKVNFNTVARVYRMLDKDRLISTQHGRGTYILPVLTPADNEQMKKLDQETKKFLKEAQRIGATPGEVLAVFHRNISNWENQFSGQTPETVKVKSTD